MIILEGESRGYCGAHLHSPIYSQSRVHTQEGSTLQGHRVDQGLVDVIQALIGDSIESLEGEEIVLITDPERLGNIQSLLTSRINQVFRLYHVSMVGEYMVNFILVLIRAYILVATTYLNPTLALQLLSELLRYALAVDHARRG